MLREAPAAIHPAASESRKWLIICLLFLFMLINYADRAVLGLAAGPIMRDLGLSHREFGLIGSAFFLCFSVFAIAIGFLVNRLETPGVLLTLALVWSLAQLPMALGGGFGLLLASRMLLGAGEGPAYPLAIHSAYKWFPDRHRTLPTAIVTQGSAFGVIVAAPGLNWIIGAYGWRAAFGVLVFVGLAWAAVWARLGREGPLDEQPTSASETAAPNPPAPYRRLLLNPTILSTWFSMFSAYWALALLIIWFPSYLRTAIGVSEASVGLWSAAPWLGGAAMILLVGWASQVLMLNGRSSRLARGILPCALGLAGALCLLALPFANSAGAKLALACFGVVLPNAIVAPAQAIMGELSPVAQRAAVLSIGNAVAGSAGIMAPFVTGALIESSISPASGFATAFALCGVVIGGANLLGLALIRPDHEAGRLQSRTAPR
jgi:ACS family D-galactonate transporter-like MFS transporter